MKIAHIAPPWLPIPPENYGGTENVLFDLVETQVAMGHDVTLFAPGDATTTARLVSVIPRSLLAEGTPWSAHLKAYYHLNQSIELAVQNAVDIIHTHLSTSSSLYIFPLTASLAVPHVTTLHSRFPFDHVQDWTGNADAFYLKRWASTVPIVTISHHARTQAPRELNVVGTIHNGLCMQCYHSLSQERDAYLMWLGRFVPEKGPHLAIAAARQAHRPLILAGTIDQSVQRSVRYFREVIEPQIDQRLIHYIGPVNRQEKVKLLSHASGLLNPIEWEEPFGMVMIEAMALGCPVISFARGAAPELIVHGETGFLVHTLDEMVQRIPQLGSEERSYVNDGNDDEVGPFSHSFSSPTTRITAQQTGSLEHARSALCADYPGKCYLYPCFLLSSG